MTAWFMHLLVAFSILLDPWLGRVLHETARRRVRQGDPLAKVKLYRTVFAAQVLSTLVVLGLCLFGGIPASRLGLGAPRSWPLSIGLALGLGGLLLWNAIQLRPKALKLREKLKDRAEAVIPTTIAEQRWFAVVSVGAGIAEELSCRGFLFYYFRLYIPHINNLENILLTSAVFGLGHLYQGWKGIVGTGIVGTVMAGLYLLSGNLFLPMFVHAATDLRALVILRPPSDAEAVTVTA